MKTAKITKRLVECSVMIALATVLSMLKLAEMPYGGSVTLASMLPMIVISYRYGMLWGFGAGAVYAAIQQLLGLNNLSYVTGWQSVLAVIILDYMLAFASVCLGGVFRGRLAARSGSAGSAQARELALGAALVCLVRYTLHTIAGATVWAGLSIPTEAALIYSLGYNATYMIPETLVNTLAIAYLGSIIDFTKPMPERFRKGKIGSQGAELLYMLAPYASALVAICGVIVDALLLFPYLQDPESGAFTGAYLAEVNWVALGIVTGACLIISLALIIVPRLARSTGAGGNE